jgi:hypothetical protein
MINNLKTPYYYCTQSFSCCGTNFWIGWEYQKDYVDKFRNQLEIYAGDVINKKEVDPFFNPFSILSRLHLG